MGAAAARRSPRFIAGIAAALAAGGVVAFAAWRYFEGPSIGAYVAEPTELVQTVVATGRVESPRRVEIGSQVVGTVESVPVEEGATVRKGQVLVVLDAGEARAALDQARSSVGQAEARIAQIHATSMPLAAEGVRQAQVTLANAETALKRAKDLNERNFVGQAALDEAQRARDLAASQLRGAELQRDSESPGGTDERVAQAALEQARAAVRAAQARLALMTIEAPSAGVLIARDVERGNVVQPGKVLMQLSPSGATQLVVQIDEKNLRLLAEGQAALASADAYPDRRFGARVAFINPAVDPMRGSVEVKLAVPEAPAYLLQDMTVSVDIEVARVGRVLAVPSEAIHEGDWVYVARGGRARRQSVTVGARGAGRVEIRSGLLAGEMVLPATVLAINDGAPVRAHAMPAKKIAGS